MIFIEHFNESFVRINTDLATLKTIAGRFSFRVQGFQFMAKYKAGVWDGFIRPINTMNGLCPKGLIPKVIDYCKENEYEVKLDKNAFSRFKEIIKFDHKEYNLPFEPYDYQIAAVERALSKKRQVILSATGSGKSVIQALLMFELLKVTEKKILMIVPNISLVTQLFQDFKDYTIHMDFNVEDNVHMIMGGKEKNANKRVYLSTWQSLDAIKDKSYFEQFEAVIADECHQYKATALSKIMENCVNAFYRIGVSGTLEDTQTAETALIGHFGPIHRVSSSADLIEREILAKLEVNLLLLKYSERVANNTKHFDYIAEMDYLVTLKERNEFITKLSHKLKGNTLILVQYIDKHGKVLEKLCKEYSNDKQIYFVYGGTEADDRNNVRKIAETHDNVIIIASYQVFSTGVNIKNLPNIVFGSPTKSKIRLLQSIGRGLRKHDKKDKCRVYDIADDLRGKKKKPNYTLKHCLDRLQIYTNEGFIVNEKKINFNITGDIC